MEGVATDDGHAQFRHKCSALLLTTRIDHVDRKGKNTRINGTNIETEIYQK